MDPNTQTHSPPLGNDDSPYVPERPARSVKAPAGSLVFSMASGASCDSLAMKQALSKRAPDGERCLITRSLKPTEACHLIAKDTKSDLQAIIEFAWRIETGRFSINRAPNLIWLTSDMHSLFDHNHWALVPTKEILIEMMTFNTLKSRPFHEAFPDDRIWEYHYVQFESWPALITQFTDDKIGSFLQPSSEAGLPASAEPKIDLPAFEHHTYPFERLGVIKSHAHPFFITYNAGQKVHRFLKSNGKHLPPQAQNYGFELTQCVTLYTSWINTILPSELAQQLPDPPHPPNNTRSRSSKPSKQQSDRDKPAAKRQRRFNPQDPSHSGAGAGAPQDCQDTTASLTADQYWPTPEQSMDSAPANHEHCPNSSGTNFPALHWTSV
ncbi:unnamed protein product, partial [Rhizoctonia solani]